MSEDGTDALGRAQMLEMQFSAHSLDLICVQEGRDNAD